MLRVLAHCGRDPEEPLKVSILIPTSIHMPLSFKFMLITSVDQYHDRNRPSNSFNRRVSCAFLSYSPA